MAPADRSGGSGLIPAHAGKTRIHRPNSTGTGAHPRSRGENFGLEEDSALVDGSSPLTRGKRPGPHARAGDPRLIPAHAGKTRGPGRSEALPWAHPRSRGENQRPALYRASVVGSSPLTRGKRPRGAGHRSQRRLIPAHAGKTAWTASPTRRARAHPRSRGENFDALDDEDEDDGSSPLTRGKPKYVPGYGLRGGLIPAHAGKTACTAGRSSGAWAHPRSRGENCYNVNGNKGVTGSSPLTRGKHFLTCAFIAQIGQILESRELCASSESYSLRNVYATDAPQDQVRSIGLAPLSSRGAS